ncbi:MAG: hypothetical protein ABI921_01305 [Panacibacter sp.]
MNNQNVQSKDIKDSYRIGDCFEFKDSINDFGLILIEELFYPDGQEYKLFPVKLENSKTGIDKFKFGEVYIANFINYTNSKGITEGFQVYYFMHEKNFETLNKFFHRVGNLSIKGEYKNATGGTMASNLSDFRYQLNMWMKMFGENARLATVKDILE